MTLKFLELLNHQVIVYSYNEIMTEGVTGVQLI
jgi:hypothetical protein